MDWARLILFTLQAKSKTALSCRDKESDNQSKKQQQELKEAAIRLWDKNHQGG